jgi:hypothetical protein
MLAYVFITLFLRIMLVFLEAGVGGVLPASKRTSRWIHLVGGIRTEHTRRKTFGKRNSAAQTRERAWRLFSPRTSFSRPHSPFGRPASPLLVLDHKLALPYHCLASFVDARAGRGFLCINNSPLSRTKDTCLSSVVGPVAGRLRMGSERVKRNTMERAASRCLGGFKLWWWCDGSG